MPVPPELPVPQGTTLRPRPRVQSWSRRQARHDWSSHLRRLCLSRNQRGSACFRGHDDFRWCVPQVRQSHLSALWGAWVRGFRSPPAPSSSCVRWAAMEPGGATTSRLHTQPVLAIAGEDLRPPASGMRLINDPYAAFDNLPDVAGELRLGQLRFWLGKAKICEHIAAAWRHRDFRFVLLERPFESLFDQRELHFRGGNAALGFFWKACGLPGRPG